MGTICTYTGKMIDLENVKVEDIYIRDIAHALSLLCRYTGHTSKFYSVAEHCVLLSEAENMPGTPLARLLHDASEAYLGDVSSPLKLLLPHYQYLENRVHKVIAEKYQVDFDPVKPGDIAILMIEANALMPLEFFPGTRESLPYSDQKIEIVGWSPLVAEGNFLIQASKLGVGVYYNGATIEKIEIKIVLDDIIKLRGKYGSFDNAALKLVKEEFKAKELNFENFEVSQNYIDRGSFRICYFKRKKGQY